MSTNAFLSNKDQLAGSTADETDVIMHGAEQLPPAAPQTALSRPETDISDTDTLLLDLHIRSLTLLICLIQRSKPMAALPASDPRSPLELSTTVSKQFASEWKSREWAHFLNDMATLLVRQTHEVIATTACLYYNPKSGTQERRLVYIANPSRMTTQQSGQSSQPGITTLTVAHSDTRWTFENPEELAEEAYRHVKGQSSITTELHAANVEYYLNAIQNDLISQSRLPEDQRMESHFLLEFGGYIHIVCCAKIRARFNARIFKSLQFKNIFAEFDGVDFRESVVVDENGVASDEDEAEIVRRFNRPWPRQLEDVANLKGLTVGRINGQRHLIYNRDTVAKFHAFVEKLFRTVEKLLNLLSCMNIEKPRVKRAGDGLFLAFELIHYLSQSRAFFLHLQHPLIRARLGIAKKTSTPSTDTDTLLTSLEEEELTHETSPHAHYVLVQQWMTICARHFSAVKHLVKIGHKRFSPSIYLQSANEVDPNHRVSLKIWGLNVPRPRNENQQEDLDSTLRSILQRYGEFPPAIAAYEDSIEPHIPPEQMTIERLKWYLRAWTQTIERREGYEKGKEAANLPCKEKPTGNQQAGNIGGIQILSTSELQRKWSDQACGTYHCESVLAAVIAGRKRDTSLHPGLPRDLSFMEHVIGVSKRSCPACTEFTKHHSVYDGSLLQESAFTTGSSHRHIYPWVPPLTLWGVNEQTLPKVTTSLEKLLFQCLSMIIQIVEETRVQGLRGRLYSADTGSGRSRSGGSDDVKSPKIYKPRFTYPGLESFPS